MVPVNSSDRVPGVLLPEMPGGGGVCARLLSREESFWRWWVLHDFGGVDLSRMVKRLKYNQWPSSGDMVNSKGLLIKTVGRVAVDGEFKKLKKKFL